jgi:hypothetical protein
MWIHFSFACPGEVEGPVVVVVVVVVVVAWSSRVDRFENF